MIEPETEQERERSVVGGQLMVAHTTLMVKAVAEHHLYAVPSFCKITGNVAIIIPNGLFIITPRRRKNVVAHLSPVNIKFITAKAADADLGAVEDFGARYRLRQYDTPVGK